MSNATKAVKLVQFRTKLRTGGFEIPPFSVVKPPFDSKTARIEEVLERLKRISTPEGPFLPYLMVRNNGRPEGTGEGRSIPVPLEYPARGIARVMQEVQESDPAARGVILQPFVGQPLYAELFEDHFGPILGGIAYTATSTERGNAIVEWVVGHPAKAVEGEGKYVAYNQETMHTESRGCDWRNAGRSLSSLMDRKDWEGRRVIIGEGKPGEGGVKVIEEMGTDIGRAMFGKLLKNVWDLGELGPVYLEWAITYIQGQTRIFALQASEFAGKLAGLPSWMETALRNFDNLLGETDSDSRDLEGLKRRYRQAVEDPRAIVVGFDVAGRGRKEFHTMLWRLDIRNIRLLEKDLGEGSILLALDTPAAGMRVIANEGHKNGLDIGGIVELYSRRAQGTFRAHMGDYCRVNSILGLGHFSGINHKLGTVFPGRYIQYDVKSNLLIKGKFVLEVDESRPFGALRVERVDKVEELKD